MTDDQVELVIVSLPATIPAMLEFHYVPPMPAKPTKGSFFQTIHLKDGDCTVGLSRWFVPIEASEGVVQVLEMWVAPEFRRQGYGHRMMQATILQAVDYHRGRKSPLRRMWVNVEQKTQIVARAFLTQHSFHHVGTIKELLKDQDALIYMRSFD